MIRYLPSPSTGFGCQPPLLRQTGRGCMASTRLRRPPPPPPRTTTKTTTRPWRPFRGWQPPQRQVPWWQRQQVVRRQWQAPRRQNVWNQWSRPRGLWFKRKKRSTYSQALSQNTQGARCQNRCSYNIKCRTWSQLPESAQANPCACST